MASVFGHAIVAAAIGNTSSSYSKNVLFWVLAIFCCIIPDVDVLMFKFGIPYEHPFGHRGFTHSFAFAFMLAIIIKTSIYHKVLLFSAKGIGILLMFFIITASHGFLDAMTNGGRGIAFFAPFDNTRYFLPWRPIQVSPMSASAFFNGRAIAILKSEMIWLGIPSAFLMVITFLFRESRART